VEQLRVPSGVGQGEPLRLRDWQKDWIRNVYDPTRANGKRKIRRALWSMARKNGKTALQAALVLVHLVGPEAVRNGEVLSAASDRDQASHIYKMCKQMIELDPELSNMCQCMESVKRIVCYHMGTFYRALSADGRRQHGGNPVFVIYDELAQAPNRELYDVLTTSFGAQDEGLFVVISTQSNDPSHIMTELCEDAEKQAAGDLDDPTFYGRVDCVPEGADIYDERNWYLANPALGDFKVLEHMRSLASKAKRSPSAEASFRALELNQRVASVAGLINSKDWRACEGGFEPHELTGCPAYGALDLSSRLDLTSFSLTWVVEPGVKLVTKSWFWTHAHDIEDREKQDGAHYRAWADAGWIKILPGKSVSYNAVVADIAEIVADVDLKAINYDRWGIETLKREMDYAGVREEDFKLIEHGQGFKDMTPALAALESAAIEHILRHDGNPVATYCLSNVKVMHDPAGNRKFDKRKKHMRIDGAVTLAMSTSAASQVRPEPKKSHPYEKRGFMVL
jgi:phage terminase large subunit-like protein